MSRIVLVSEVSMYPGLRQLTRTPFVASSTAMLEARWRTAASVERWGRGMFSERSKVGQKKRCQLTRRAMKKTDKIRQRISLKSWQI